MKPFLRLSLHSFENSLTLDHFCLFLTPTIPTSKTSIDTFFIPMSSDPATHRVENSHPLTTEPLPCPRCDSTNTKFCYYNNYNFSQPRHFCKSCRRYWTHGGTLRDVPIGGRSRKNSKRCRSASSSSSSATTHEHLPENPISILAGVNFDSTCNHVSVYENMNDGLISFTSLLNSHNSGLLSLTGYEQMGHGVGRGAWSYPEAGDDLVGGYEGQNGGKVREAENECLAWPELGISMQSKSLK